MKKHLTIILEFEITSEDLKFIKKQISGKCRYIEPYLIFDDINKEESTNILLYLDEKGSYKRSSDYDYYTTDELLEFEYFYCIGQRKPDVGIQLLYNVRELNGHKSFDYSNFCTNCKKGYRQIAPLFVRGLSTKYESKKFVSPSWTYWVVSAYFKEKIIEQNISGIDFWELFNGKGQASKTNFQMKPKNVLENVLSLEDVDCIKECSKCDNMRVGIKGEVVKLYKESKEKLLDFNELSEYNISKLNGIYIISKQLLQIFIDENILPHKDIDVHPVEFV